MFLWRGYKLKRVLVLQYVVNGYLWYWLLYFPREPNWSRPPWPRHFGLAIPNQMFVCRHMSHFRKLLSVWITPNIGEIRAERRQPMAHQGRTNHRGLIYVHTYVEMARLGWSTWFCGISVGLTYTCVINCMIVWCTYWSPTGRTQLKVKSV